MAPSLPVFSAVKLQSYLFRIPLFTRIVIFIILILSLFSHISAWNLQEWGALIPNKIELSSMYRTNTFPLVHIGLLHAVSNVLALTPLLERFEVEYGTLTSLALFFGPVSTIPALLYTLVERVILRMNTSVLGASIWVFTLLGMEAVKTHRINPFFMIGTTPIPTLITPIILALFISVMVANTSFLGHLCGLAFGYGWGFGYLQFLAPPEWGLRWIEGKLITFGRLPHYISVEQKTNGRFGVLPTVNQNIMTQGIPVSNFVANMQRH